MESSTTPSDVIIIGAGFSGKLFNDIPYTIQAPISPPPGICAGLQLKNKFKEARFEIFDKEEKIGGIWSKNTYPNLG